MARSTKVDVVMADEAPAHTAHAAVGEPQSPEAVDTTPDPHHRIIVLAPTKSVGHDEARAHGIEPVAVVTPRSPHAARGVAADALWGAPGLTAEDRETLMPHVLPSLTTTRED